MQYNEELERINQVIQNTFSQIFKKYCYGQMTLEQASNCVPQISDDLAARLDAYEAEKAEFLEAIRSVYKATSRHLNSENN